MKAIPRGDLHGGERGDEGVDAEFGDEETVTMPKTAPAAMPAGMR